MTRIEHDFRDDDDEIRTLRVALSKAIGALDSAMTMLDRRFHTVRWRREYTFDETLTMLGLVDQAIPYALWPDAVKAIHPVRQSN